jgi:hypothetical protein
MPLLGYFLVIFGAFSTQKEKLWGAWPVTLPPTRSPCRLSKWNPDQPVVPLLSLARGANDASIQVGVSLESGSHGGPAAAV